MRSVYASEAGAANKSNAKGDSDTYVLQWSDQNWKIFSEISSHLILSMYSDNLSSSYWFIVFCSLTAGFQKNK